MQDGRIRLGRRMAGMAEIEDDDEFVRVVWICDRCIHVVRGGECIKRGELIESINIDGAIDECDDFCSWQSHFLPSAI